MFYLYDTFRILKTWKPWIFRSFGFISLKIIQYSFFIHFYLVRTSFFPPLNISLSPWFAFISRIFLHSYLSSSPLHNIAHIFLNISSTFSLLPPIPHPIYHSSNPLSHHIILSCLTVNFAEPPFPQFPPYLRQILCIHHCLYSLYLTSFLISMHSAYWNDLSFFSAFWNLMAGFYPFFLIYNLPSFVYLCC